MRKPFRYGERTFLLFSQAKQAHELRLSEGQIKPTGVHPIHPPNNMKMTDEERMRCDEQRERYRQQCEEFKKKLERYFENRRKLILERSKK